MKEITSVREICEKIWQLEKRYELLDFEIDGVKIWQFLRMEIYVAIARKVGLLAQPHTESKSFWKRLRSLPPYLVRSVFRNPLFGSYQVDIMVFDHDRHKRIDGKNIDIYTHYMIEEFRNRKARFIVLERPYLRKHAKTDRRDRILLDAFISYNFFRRKFSRVDIPEDKRRKLDEINRSLNEAFSTAIDLTDLFLDNIKRFKLNYRLYRRLLKKRRPKQIYLVVSYGQGDLIKAARDLGIEIIELQHGGFSKYHLGYSFPDRRKPLEYFPDAFYSWSGSWSQIIDLPIPKSKVVDYGFPHFCMQKEKYRSVKKQKNKAVVLSQGSIGERMARLLLTNHHSLKDLDIVYKLHPGEYDRWEQYPSLKRLADYDNVSVVKDADLYQLLAQAEYQIGVYSTAIYEGLEFGCKTILLDLPGIEYMESLLTAEKAMLLTDFTNNRIPVHAL